MIEVNREPRAAVMIVVEASWEDHAGDFRAIAACIENKSASGACIRVGVPIAVGSKLRIRSRWEQYSGIAKYCQSEGLEYLVGIQREMMLASMPEEPAPTINPAASPVPEPAAGSNLPILARRSRSRGTAKKNQSNENPTPPEKLEVVAPRVMSEALSVSAREVGKETENMSLIHISKPHDRDALPGAEEQTKQRPQEKQAGSEGTNMRRSWLESALWNSKQEVPSGKLDSPIVNGNGNGEAAVAQITHALQVAPPLEKIRVNPVADGVTSFQVEPLVMEDIYRAAGIMSPRKGYGINKVVEMLHSEHVRGLSKEMMRAAVLMALDAAGIPIEEILMDARARQNALDSYEASQKKVVEEEWARKAEENLQIQAELERIKEQFAARINRQLNAVARGKAAFGSWQALKQQEYQNMAEAAELCLKLTVSEKPAASIPDVSMAAGSQR